MSTIRRGRFMIDEIGKYYTSIANQVFRDPRLSAYAKTAFGLISTHQDGYDITAESLCAKHNPRGEGMKESLSTVKKALRELESYGYLVRVRIRDKGRLAGTYYEITDMPEGFEISAPPPYPDAPRPDAEGPQNVEAESYCPPAALSAPQVDSPRS